MSYIKKTMIIKILTLGVLISLGGLIGCMNSKSIAVDNIKSTGKVPVKLYVLDGGKIIVPDMSLFDPAVKKGTSEEYSNTVYLIKHPKGVLLWDTGLPDSLVNTENGMSIMNGALRFTVKTKLLRQLSEIDVKPSDIDFLAFTNLHPVFTGNILYFKKAKVLLQQSEYEQAFSDDAPNYGYNPESYSVLNNMNVEKLNGHLDIFGDGSVVILSAPATSLGHQVLYIDLPETGPIITAGDLYNSQEARDNYTIPGHVPDKEKMAESFVLIDRLIEQTGATLWLNHDIKKFDSIIKSPGYYE